MYIVHCSISPWKIFVAENYPIVAILSMVHTIDFFPTLVRCICAAHGLASDKLVASPRQILGHFIIRGPYMHATPL